jgi:hypothetical protein
LDEERIERQQERITANETLNQHKSNLPQIEIEPICDDPVCSDEQVKPLVNETDDESDVVPISLFEDGESEHE